MKKIVFILFISMFWLNGCSILPEARPLAVNYYDFGAIATEAKFLPKNIRIGHVRSVFPSEKRMIFREKGSRLLFDECNRWALSPEQLVQGRIQAALPDREPDTQTQANEQILNVEILSVEGDLEAKTANFAVRFELNDNAGKPIYSKTFFENAQLSEMTASAFAGAIGRCVDLTLQRFAKECNP